MTTTDDNLGTEDIAQETAILDRLRELREAHDAAHAALQDAIAEQRRAGYYWEVLSHAIDEHPAWCDGKCDTDPIDGSVHHSTALLQLAGRIALEEGDVPVAWLQAGATRQRGGVLPEPTFSIYSSPDDYELDAAGVRLFGAVLLGHLEKITGVEQDDPSPLRLETTLHAYGAPD